MKKQKIDKITFAVTYIVSFICFDILTIEKMVSANSIARAFLVGLSFALPAFAAFAALHISAKRRRKVKIQLPALLSSVTAIILALCFALGFIGQLVYSFRINKEETIIEGGCDIVLMLDDSGSMASYSSDVRTASIAFADSLSMSCRLAVGIFAQTVGYFEDLTVMDSTGKQKIKNFFNNRFAGSTDLNAALKQAYICLMSNDEGKQKSVVIVTDGCGSIDEDVKKEYINNNIALYTIRISGSEGDGTEDLIKFVNKTGGFDTAIDLTSGTERGVEDLAQAFSNISGRIDVETSAGFADGLLIYDEDVSIYRALIRLITLIILAALVQMLYFRKLDAKAIIGCIISAVIACAFMTFMPTLGYASTLITSVAIFTVFAKLNIKEGAVSDV